MWKWITGAVAAAAVIAFGVWAYVDASASDMPVTTDVGPTADVAQIRSAERKNLGSLAGEADMFSVVDGDYAVNATNLGEGWGTGAFKKSNGTWKSLHLSVNTDACSLAKAGLPADIAQRISHEFEGRMLHQGGEGYACFTEPESVTTDEGPASAIAAIRKLAIVHDRHWGDCCLFSVVSGDYAVNASFLGDGYHERLYRKVGGKWASLHVNVYTNACSLRKAGAPAAVADRLDHNFRSRNLDDAGDPGSCTTEPDRAT